MNADPRLIALRDRLTGLVLRGSSGVAYHIRERIGEGAQGWVFTANWDEPGGFVVIVKILRPDAITSDALTRFQTEAEVLQRLSQGPRPNPYIVRFYDHAVANMRSPIGGDPLVLPFTVLEYVKGPSLDAVLAASRDRGLALDRVRRIARQVSQALELVHEQKVVHRDLKPSNILLATDMGTETAKVTDFGLVKLTDLNLHRTTSLAGASIGYAPPEQFETGNKRVSPRTDVFSFASIVYEMLAGRPAFPYDDRENALIIVTRILKDPRPRLATSPGIPPELHASASLVDKLDAEIARALHPDPNERHGSVREFYAAIEPLLQAAMERPLASRPPPSKLLPFMETSPAYDQLAAKIQTQESAGSQPTLEELLTEARASRARLQPPAQPARESFVPASASGAFANAPHPVSLTPAPSSPSVHPPTAPVTTPVALGPTIAAAGPDPGRAEWSFRVLTPPIGPNIVRAASLAQDGSFGVGIGPGGFARWDRQWIAMNMPRGVDPRSVRGIRLLRNRDVVMFGDGGLVVRIAPSGAHEVWPIADRAITFLGLHADELHERFMLVGERGGAGVVVNVVAGRVALSAEVPAARRLCAVTRLVSGQHVACGDDGAIVRIEETGAHHVRNVGPTTLGAIEALMDGGALVVGTGGHALSLSPRLEATLEPVQTTKDLGTLALDVEGTAWAGAGSARILRRTEGSWVRKSGEFGLASATLTLSASPRWIRAIGDDGAVLEGTV